MNSFDPWKHSALTEALAAEAAAGAIEGREAVAKVLDPLAPALRLEVERQARLVLDSLTDIPADLQPEVLPAIVHALRHGGHPLAAAVEALAAP